MLALILVAFSLGLSNFAAAIGIGVPGVDARKRLRVALIFGVFEAGMPVLGLTLGRALAGPLGGAARWTGAALLAGTGIYTVWQARKTDRAADAGDDGRVAWRLLVTGLALSIDNLTVGFALGTYHVHLLLAAAVIGVVSAGMSLAGLEAGGRIGARIGQRGELLGGILLVVVAALLGAGVL